MIAALYGWVTAVTAVTAVSAVSAVGAATPPTDPLGPVSQDPDQVRDAACRIVESRDVCGPPAAPDTIVPRTTGASGGGGFLGVMLWLMLIAVVVAIAYVGYRYLAERSSRSTSVVQDDEVDPDDDALVGTVIIDRSREPRGWREEADRHRAQGRIRDALRCRYRALVADLARRGLLDEIPGRTTGEERRQLRTSAPDAGPFFREAADLFDASWYGHVMVSAADDDRMQTLEGEVLANAAALSHRVPRSYEMGSR